MENLPEHDHEQGIVFRPRFDAQGSHLLIWGFVRQTKRRQRLQARRTFTLASEVAGVLDLELDRGECVVVVGIGRPGGVEDIAQATGVSRETAKSRLRYALAKLKRGLGEAL